MTATLDFTTGSPLVEGAYRFAREAHSGPHRRRNTDISHPLQVARLLRDAEFDDDIVAAALLHDVVEDTTIEIDELAQRFGAPVAELVAALTEDNSIEDYEERKAAHRSRIASSSPRAAVIFAADKLASARGLPSSNAAVPDAKVRHYEATLRTLKAAHPGLAFLNELETELRRRRFERQP